MTLTLKRVRLPPGEVSWIEDYEILHDGECAGRIYRSPANPADRPWYWGVYPDGAYGSQPVNCRGYAATLEDAMALARARWDAVRG